MELSVFSIKKVYRFFDYCYICDQSIRNNKKEETP